MTHAAPTRAPQRPRRKIATAVIAAAVLLGASIASSSSAGAATEQINFTLTGSTTLGTQPPIAFPDGSGWSADFDTDTGELTNGTITVPSSTIEPLPGVVVGVTFADAAPATGFYDPDTGELDISASFSITLSITVLNATCTVGPLAAQLSTDNAGGSVFTGDPATGTVTAINFTVPAIAVTGTCDAAAAGAINSTLGLPTSTSNITMTLVSSDQPVPPTTTTTATTAAPTTPTSATAAPATAANTTANLTG
jgi:hypothetical protein